MLNSFYEIRNVNSRCSGKNIYKIIFLLIFNCVFLVFNSFSQQITFQKTFSTNYIDRGHSVQQTTDGGYIIAGETQVSSGGSFVDVYLIKTDANGDTLWTKTFGGTNIDRGYSVQQTTDEGYVIAGETRIGSGNDEVYLIKTDANGDTLWTKTFGGVDNDMGYSVQQTADEGYIIAGSANSFTVSNSEVYLIKTDVNGDSLWTKTFGGAGDEIGSSVQQTTDGGYIITGYTDGFGAGNDDVYVIKTNTNGDSLWTKTFGGTGLDQGHSVQQTTDGGYIITGITYSFGAGNPDVYLIKTDANGDSLWTKTFGLAFYDEGMFVRQTTDGGYVITGLYAISGGGGDTELYLIKTDSTGNFVWTKTYGGTGTEKGYSVQQTTDEGYIITGYTKSFPFPSNDVYLIKTDSLGNSGCNQGSPATIITTPATQVTSPPTIVTSPATIVSNTTTIVGSGSIVNTLCSTVSIIQNPNQTSYIQISPNPLTTQSTLTFSNPQKEKFLFALYDITGRVTENVSTVDDKIILTKGNKHTGVYLFNLTNEKTGERMNGKIVIRDE